MKSVRPSFRSVSIAATVCIALSLFAGNASSAALLTGFGGPAGYGANRLPENDDGSTGVIDITSAFPAPGLRFFGRYYTSFFVNNNGNVTFGGALGTYTPAAFPVASQPMIAPYWGDVDTRGGWTATRNGVYWHLQPGLIVVTWHNVGYYSVHDNLQNSFQIVIRSISGCGVGDFSVEYRYNRCEWHTGDASGGMGGTGCRAGTTVGVSCVPAQAGFDAGDRVNFVTLPGSRTFSVLNLCTTSNVGMPGIWRFTIRGGALPCVGSGERCDIPANTGACREGIQQCRGMTTACIQTVMPSAERCDGVDNDCNGMTDDGSMLCPADYVCDRGSCVPRCVEGACFEGQTCNSRGFCEETACAGMTCPMGQRCRGGSCVGACDGIYCPPPSVCRVGRCLDPCDGMMCMTGEVCEAGRCVPHCRCRTCDPGTVCNTTDGHCVPTDCAGVNCPMGSICRGGMCADPCIPPPDQRACPDDQMCEGGRCVTRTTAPDAGTDGAVGDVVRPGEDSGTGDDAATDDTGMSTGGDTGSDVRGRDAGFGRTDGGCACRIAGAPAPARRTPALFLAIVLAAGALARRRRNG